MQSTCVENQDAANGAPLSLGKQLVVFARNSVDAFPKALDSATM
jgi:hypothetical protein